MRDIVGRASVWLKLRFSDFFEKIFMLHLIRFDIASSDSVMVARCSYKASMRVRFSLGAFFRDFLYFLLNVLASSVQCCCLYCCCCFYCSCCSATNDYIDIELFVLLLPLKMMARFKQLAKSNLHFCYNCMVFQLFQKSFFLFNKSS